MASSHSRVSCGSGSGVKTDIAPLPLKAPLRISAQWTRPIGTLVGTNTCHPEKCHPDERVILRSVILRSVILISVILRSVILRSEPQARVSKDAGSRLEGRKVAPRRDR